MSYPDPDNNKLFFIIFPAETHVVLLVLVVTHDGDDGVVDEQSQGQNS